jgi:hypothetical protein
VISIPDNGIDRSDDVGPFGEGIHQGQDRFLIGNGDIDAGHMQDPNALYGSSQIFRFDHKGDIGSVYPLAF